MAAALYLATQSLLRGWGASPTAKDDLNTKTRWPFELEISAATRKNATIWAAFRTMTAFLTDAAKKFSPPDQGTPWDAYRKSFDVPKEMIWRGAAFHQVNMFGVIPELRSGIDMRVVGTHRSKSIDLPIVELCLPRNHVKVRILDNFHGISVKVDSRFSIEDTRGFDTLFDTRDYKYNQRRFSCEFGDYASLLTFMGALIHQDARTPFKPLAECSGQKKAPKLES